MELARQSFNTIIPFAHFILFFSLLLLGMSGECASFPSLSPIKLIRVAPRVFSPQESVAAANTVRFYYENTDGRDVSLRIFDAVGAVVNLNVHKESDTIFAWDGRDRDGNIVKAGMYIYQLEAGEQNITGVIVVAR
jgi:hypothetical protein